MKKPITLYQEVIEERIMTIRSRKVIIDSDLAGLYGVTTKVLNQSVKRNIGRFPSDFMFELTRDEKNELVTNCDRLKQLKFSSSMPRAFTEHGALMLASILNSQRAIDASIFIIRAFVHLRMLYMQNTEVVYKLKELESRISKHDSKIQDIVEILRQLMAPPKKPKRKIGFQIKESIPKNSFRNE